MDFNGILIGSENPEALIVYYTKLLGEPAYAGGDYSSWRIGSGYMSIGPHSEVKGRNAHPGRIIWNIESTDVKGDFDRMVAAGAIVIREPYGFDEGGANAVIATLADPDDNYFQLMSPMNPEDMSS